MTPKWILRLAGYNRARERRLAEESSRTERAALNRHLGADERRLLARMEAVARVPSVVLGTTAEGVPYRISLGDLTSLPGWVTAATGAGKTRFAGAFMSRVVAAVAEGAPIAIVAVDGKGDTADTFQRAISSFAERMTGHRRDEFLARVLTLKFFDRSYLPSWPLLSAVPGIPIPAQADAFAEVLNDVVADASVGPRQRSTLAAIASLAIEFDIPAVELPWVLSSPRDVAALALRSSLPSVRLDLARFDREPQGSIDGLLARLGILLRVPSLKAVLSGPRPFDFSTCFEPGSFTTISFAGADLGARSAQRAMGSLVLSALANAAFDPRRTVKGTTLTIVDEPQTLMTGVTMAQMDRLITLGRSFGAAGLVLLHQGATQLPLELQSSLNTNVVWRVIGRSSERDALASSEWLARTGRVPRRREAGARATQSAFLNEGEEQRFRVAELGRLPPRHFLVADRRNGSSFAPRIVVAPDHDPPPWSEIDPDVADRVQRGAAGFPRAQLETRVRELEERAAARLADELRTEEPAPRRRGRPAATPDVVGQPRDRSHPGGVP